MKPFAGRPMRNPHEGDAAAVAAGAKLFTSYNCIDCHGAGGSGAMGPSLGDGRWHCGGSSAEVFESIYQGRPEGMPAWGSLIDDDQIWLLVSYVRSLDAGKNVTTENFGGKTVERTGHE
ncbi:MAG: c-type cytochrome [Polaromonas sp.]|nr:c-type cytochrome [Gemmatimonadaceae bacterium]